MLGSSNLLYVQTCSLGAGKCLADQAVKDRAALLCTHGTQPAKTSDLSCEEAGQRSVIDRALLPWYPVCTVKDLPVCPTTTASSDPSQEPIEIIGDPIIIDLPGEEVEEEEKDSNVPLILAVAAGVIGAGVVGFMLAKRR